MRTTVGTFLLASLASACVAADPPRDLNPVTIKPAPTHAPIRLAENGQPKATICVMDFSCSERERGNALLELKECLRDATGAELPVSNGKVVDGPAIVLGACPEAAAAGLDGTKMPVEGFAIKTAPNRVFIVGNDDRKLVSNGTAWGVYEFLERVVGARFYWMVESGGRHVPRAATLAVSPMWIEDAPVFRIRLQNVTGGDVIRQHAAMRSAHTWPVGLVGHTPRWGWTDRYSNKRIPEVFQLRKDGWRDELMLCYGNPRTLELHLEILSQVFDNKEAYMYGVDMGLIGNAISVSPWDADVNCYCRDCRRLWDPQGGQYGTASKIMASFVSRLAAEVKKRWPDKTVVFLPYSNYTLAPKGFEFPDNVEAQVCGMPGIATYKEPPVLAEVQGNIDYWHKLTHRKVQTWEYPCWPADRTSAPYHYPHVVKAFYQANRDKVVGSFINGTEDHWPRQHLSLYAWMKCLWNPDFDVDAMMDELCRRMFGPAAATMRELVRIQCDGWEKSRWPNGQLSAKAVYTDSFPKPVLEKMKALLAEARQKIGNDPVLKQRLDYYERPFADFYGEYGVVMEGKGVRPLVAKKVGENPTIDGKLNDAVWEKAAATSFRRNVKTGEEAEPRHPTWVKAVWTGDGVTFGFHFSEKYPDKLYMTNANRDDGTLWGEDCCEVFLDPSGKNGGKVVQLLISAAGGLYDSLAGDMSWTCEGLKFVKAIGQDYWSMEIHVPLKALPGAMAPGTGVSWSGQFTRFRNGANKPDKDSEATKMNAQFGGFNSNTADFAPIRFEE